MVQVHQPTQFGHRVGVVVHPQVGDGLGRPGVHPHAIDACAQVVSPMEPLGDDHSAACIRVHELARAPG